MKLRLRSFETKETLKIETPNPCSLQQLKELVSQKLPSASNSSVTSLSLNRKDELTTESPQESIQSIGITSGDLIYFTTNPDGFSASPKSEQPQNPQPLIPDSSKQDEKVNIISSETVESSNNNNNSSSEEVAEPMEIEDDESIVISEVGKSFSVPSFLRKVFTKELGDTDNLNHRLLRVAVHAVLLESGFVEIDPASKSLKNNNDNFSVKDNWYLAPVHYTLSNIIASGPNIETVKIKFQNLGRYRKVYGSLVNGTTVHSMLVDEHRLVPFLNVVWANCGPVVATVGGNNKMSNVEPEKQVFEFWRKIKDGISLPLLIDLCEKTGLKSPPCFMQLPTELKLKILESVAGVDIAKVSCVCSELRYLASSDDLWKRKYIEEFGNVMGADSTTGFKYRFAKTYESKKRKRSVVGLIARRRLPLPYAPPFGAGFPGIIGGDYDLFPNLGPRGLGGLGGLPHGRNPRLRNVRPDCNLGGFAGFGDH